MTNFELDASIYDLMVDWEARLKNELPFFQGLLGSAKKKTLLDVACGTGRHALEFAKLGHRVTAVDSDPQMVELAQKQMFLLGDKRSNQLTLSTTSFEDLVADSSAAMGPYDFITCLGNSLSLLSSQDALRKTIRAFSVRLATGGHLIFQIVNYGRLKKATHWTGPLLRRLEKSSGKRFYFIKLFDRISNSAIRMTIAVLYQDQRSHWKSMLSQSTLCIFKPTDIAKVLQSSGFTDWKFFGNYQQETFIPEKSPDIIVVARK